MKEKNYGLDLTSGRISTLLLRFAGPFLAAGLVTALYGAVDLFVVGQYTDQGVISGVSTGTQIMNIVYSATIGIGTGGTVLMAHRIGERDKAGSARAAGSILLTAAALMVFMTAVMWFLREILLTALDTPEEARPSATNFVKLATIGVPFNVGFNIISSLARGLGNSRAPSIVGAIGCVVNIALALLFVGALRMREIGVALATALAQVTTFTIIGVWLLRKKFPFPFTRGDFRIDWKSVGMIFWVGTPLWLQELLITGSFMIITGLVNGMGVVASASVGIIAKVFSLGGMFPLAIGNAVSAMTAQNLGAGRRDRALRALRCGIAYSLIIEVALCVYCQISPESITALFARELPVIEGAAAYLRAFSLDLTLISFIFCINAYLSGHGKSIVSMAHSVAATFGVRVPLSIVFSRMRGVDLNTQLYYLGFAAPIASILSITICVIYIARLNSKRGPAVPPPRVSDI
ncbi:MAG: MATE family efflux transporter [Oscillospiraceae bacterium]|jgi:putative MATE family efflux protein|nr:MATE family efflux transporter [Oscillospiraceae bacterium]